MVPKAKIESGSNVCWPAATAALAGSPSRDTPAAARELRVVRCEALRNLKGGLRALHRTLELPGAKIEKGEPVMAPGVPKDYPDAKKLVTEDCIKPSI